MHTVFECQDIDSLWNKIKELFHLQCENYEVFAHPTLNHLSLALISQIIYNRIRLNLTEEKKYHSDNSFIISHTTYLLNRENNVINQHFLSDLLKKLKDF